MNVIVYVEAWHDLRDGVGASMRFITRSASDRFVRVREGGQVLDVVTAAQGVDGVCDAALVGDHLLWEIRRRIRWSRTVRSRTPEKWCNASVFRKLRAQAAMQRCRSTAPTGRSRTNRLSSRVVSA